jgi:hypothetical protein
MRVLTHIREWWRRRKEIRALGFSQQQLSKLYVELASRDDSCWVSVERGGLTLKVNNTAIAYGGLTLSIVGDYETGEFKAIYKLNPKKGMDVLLQGDWDLILSAKKWDKAKRGSDWELVVRALVEGGRT